MITRKKRSRATFLMKGFCGAMAATSVRRCVCAGCVCVRGVCVRGVCVCGVCVRRCVCGVCVCVGCVCGVCVCAVCVCVWCVGGCGWASGCCYGQHCSLRGQSG